MKNYKKYLIFIFFIVLIFVLGFIFYRNYSLEKNKNFITEKVRKGDLKISFSITGKTVIDRYDLKFLINGKVVDIGVKEGDYVKKGQYLISLDSEDVRKNLEKSLKDYLISRNDYDQANQVTYPNGALNDTIKRILEKNQYNLDKAVIDVELKNIALRQSYLYSPIDGFVSAVNVKIGETVNTSNPVIVITNPDSLFFEAYAEDVEILKINKNQKINIKLDALPGYNFSGEIVFISNLATVDQNGFSTYKIKVKINNNKNLNLLDGMSGEITFITKEKNNVLIIPNKSVYRKNNKSYVLKFIDNKNQEEKEIITGFTDGKYVEVLKGLSAGDVVLIQ